MLPSMGVILSERDDLFRLIPPSGISLKPIVDEREMLDCGGAWDGADPNPTLRDSWEGGGVADIARVDWSGRLA